MDKDQNYIKHILDSIAFLEDFINDKNFDEFRSSRAVQNVIIRELEVIGEAAKRLSENFKNKHSEIPWKNITGMRDRLIHDYFKIDYKIVWQVVQNDLSKLKSALSPK